MRSVSYRSFEDEINGGLNSNSRLSREYPLVVNCAGFMNIEKKFGTNNRQGRLDYYLMYIVDGRLKIYMPRGAEYAEAGSFIIFPPNCKYRYSFSGHGTLSYYFAHFSGSEVDRYIEELMLSPTYTVFKIPASEDAVGGFTELFDVYARNGEFRDHALSSAMDKILIALAEAKIGGERKPLFGKSLTFLNAKYTDDIRIPDLAAMEGLSLSRYNAVFKRVVGMPPTKYIISLRIKHACTLLSGTNLGISEIGAMVGYEDNHFFSKIFKSTMGISPQKYRAEKNSHT